MKYFLEVFEAIPRQGPGSNKYTRKAYDMIKGYLPEHPKILDIGCGTGMASFKLAEISNGHVTAIDNHQPFVDYINKKAEEEYLDEIIEAQVGDMNSLSLPEGRFDVLWSEGAIYNMGFEKALQELQKFVKSMGFMVVSEAVWIKNTPPKELISFWDKEYKGIASIDEKLKIIENCGLRIIANFTLPEDGWINFFYGPLEKKVAEFREKNKDNKEAIDTYNEIQNEIELYKKYKDYFSYQYFVLKKS